MLALTRGRVVWSTSESFRQSAEEALEQALRRPRDRAQTVADVREMRALIARERPPQGPWDLKLSPGGLVDVEFAAKYLQLLHAAEGGPLRANTGDALAALASAGLANVRLLGDLIESWRLQQDLAQLLKVALEDQDDPDGEPRTFRALLARAGQAADFKALKTRLAKARATTRAAYESLVL